MRSEVLKDILSGITEEDEKKWSEKRKTRHESLTVDYQLGYYIGELIYYRHLPTIEIDSIHTRKMIKMDPSEVEEFNRIDKIWFDTYQKTKETESSKKEWDAVMAYRRKMEDKYLPKELSIHLPMLNVRNIKDFKDGLIVSLWNCDICHYSLDPEDITVGVDPDYYGGNIKLVIREEKK